MQLANPHIEQNHTQNQFINNFNHKFIPINKHYYNTFYIMRHHNSNISNLQQIQNDQLQKLEIQDENSSPTQILQHSRARIINTKSLKSLQFINNNERQNSIQSFNLNKLKQKEEQLKKISNNRFSEYHNKIEKSINKLQAICQQNFGGIENINRQLNKHLLTKDQLIKYYAKMIPKNTDLPLIIQKHKRKSLQKQQKLPKLRSHSQKNIVQSHNQQYNYIDKRQVKHNKWYIDPQKRFSINKDKQLYDWRTQEGVKNVIRTQQLKIKGKQIHDLIKQVKDKFHREPIFCKYVKFS